MTIEERLKSMIIEKYGSMTKFSSVIGIPNPTLASIMSRGITKASISNIIKICQELNISADELANNKIVPVASERPPVYFHDVEKMIDFMKNNPEQFSNLTIDSIDLSNEERETLINCMSMAVEFIRETRNRREK